MRNLVYRLQCTLILMSVVATGIFIASGETPCALSAERHRAVAGHTLSVWRFLCSVVLWTQFVMPIFASATLLPTKPKSPNFTNRTVNPRVGGRAAASVLRASQ